MPCRSGTTRSSARSSISGTVGTNLSGSASVPAAGGTSHRLLSSSDADSVWRRQGQVPVPRPARQFRRRPPVQPPPRARPLPRRRRRARGRGRSRVDLVAWVAIGLAARAAAGRRCRRLAFQHEYDDGHEQQAVSNPGNTRRLGARRAGHPDQTASARARSYSRWAAARRFAPPNRGHVPRGARLRVAARHSRTRCAARHLRGTPHGCSRRESDVTADVRTASEASLDADFQSHRIDAQQSVATPSETVRRRLEETREACQNAQTGCRRCAPWTRRRWQSSQCGSANAMTESAFPHALPSPPAEITTYWRPSEPR